MMRDSKSKRKKSIQEVPTPRTRKPKLERVSRDITKRKKVEEVLRSERNRLISIFEAMADGVHIVNQEYDIEYVNPVLEKDFGSWEGRKCYEYFQDRKEICSCCKNKDVFAGKTVHWEWHSFKNHRTYDLVDTPLKNPDGSISKLEIFHDITERKQAEDKLRQIKESYDRLTDNADEAIFTVEAKGGHVTYLNAAAERIFGYSKAEWTKDPSLGFKIIHPDFKEKQKELIKEINTNKKIIKNAFLGWIAKDGRELLMEYTILPITDENGEVVYFESIGRDITERKKAEEELKQSKEFLANTINALDDTFFVKDEEHRWAALNNAACEAIGRPREDLIGKSDYDFFPKEQADVFWERDNLVLETGETSVNEEEVTWHGKLHTISTKKSLFTDFITGKRFIVGTARDITERKQAEKALRQSEQQYRALVEQSLQGIVIFQDFRIVFANTTAAKIADLTIEDVLALSLEDMMTFVPPEERADALERLKNRFAGKAVDSEYEICLVRKNGDEFWLNLFFSPIEYLGKSAIQLAFIDITERKKAEEELKQSKEFLANTINALDDTFFVKDEEHRWAALNNAACEAMGRPRVELIGKTDYDLLPKEQADVFWEEDKLALETGETSVNEEEVTWHGKLHTISTKRSLFKDFLTGKKFIVGIIRDITERKKAEERLLEYQGQLKSLASQLTLAEERERRRIATELHDEISQSLFISKMKLEALHKSTPDKKLNDTLDEINNSLGRIIAAMRSLIFDLSSPILYEFGFEEAVAEWLNERVEKKHGIETELEVDGSLKQLDDDIRVLLFRDVRELLTNVVKHARAKKIKVSIRKVNSRIYVSVQDDGVGFDSAETESMITKKEAFGLFSIRERLEHFGGRLEIKSAPGCGCRVTITSPLKREDINKDKQK